MQVSLSLKLLFTIPIILALFCCFQTTLASSTSLNNKIVSTNITNPADTEILATDVKHLSSDTVSSIQHVPDNNDANVISSKITSQKLTAATVVLDDYFVKIGDEIVPIDYDLFSSRETTVKYAINFKHYPEIENINLCPDDTLDIFTICDKTILLRNRLKLHKETTFRINKDQLNAYLKSLNKSSRKSAKNVILATNADDNIIILKKEEYGHELDIDKTLETPLKYFKPTSQKRVISLPIKLISPEITSSNYQSLGLKEKIGSGKSNFRGSPKNRIHNIHNATGKFEGIIIAPDETFSFVENLGDVDENTGYKEELVIKDNKTFPEFGGGICQVSTTLFRSAVNTGLEITERRNHAYPVQYYSPQGTDATIYIPKPDLQFKNNTTKYIMLQPHIEGTILTFDIFGTSDGRQVETEGPTLLKRGDDGSRKYVWWQIINDKDGNQISKKGFWSYYQDAAKFHGGNHDTKLTSKPKNWSGKQWKQYKREHGM